WSRRLASAASTRRPSCAGSPSPASRRPVPITPPDRKRHRRETPPGGRAGMPGRSGQALGVARGPRSIDAPGRLAVMGPDFAPLAERLVDALLAASPTDASFAGDHRFDDRLDDWSSDAVAARVQMLRDASDALTAADIDELDPAEQVDHAILTARVDADLFELTEIREYEWNPLAHNPSPA